MHRTQREGEGGRCICLCSWNITRDHDELTLLTSQQLITTYLLNRELALLWVIKYYTNCVIMELWRQLYTRNISYCVKETRQVIGNTMVKLRLDHNNLDKAMADNPSVIECQHIAWCPVWWCQCICTHSVAWRVLLCPVWSMLGGRTEATAEAAQWPCPASQPLDMGWYSLNTFYHSK